MRKTRISPGLLISCLLVSAATTQHKTSGKKHSPALLDEQALEAQVMLDRAGYSPGEIDAAMGTSTERALDAYTRNGGNASTLPSDVLTAYRITEQDAAGPFTPRIPSDMMEMA